MEGFMAKEALLTVPMTQRLPDFKLKHIMRFFTQQDDKAMTSEFCLLTEEGRYESAASYKKHKFIPCDDAEVRRVQRRNEVKKWMREFKQKQKEAAKKK